MENNPPILTYKFHAEYEYFEKELELLFLSIAKPLLSQLMESLRNFMMGETSYFLLFILQLSQYPDNVKNN